MTADVRLAPRTVAEEIGRLAAEPHLLAQWAANSHHPRLAAAYTALGTRTEARVRHLVAAAEAAGLARDAITDATLRTLDQARGITLELGRLKWLVAARRDRLAREGLPGYADVAERDDEERRELEALLGDLGRGVC